MPCQAIEENSLSRYPDNRQQKTPMQESRIGAWVWSVFGWKQNYFASSFAGGAGASSTFGAAGAAAAGVAAVAQPLAVAQPPQDVVAQPPQAVVAQPPQEVVAQPPHAGFASQHGLASQQLSCLQHFTFAGLHFSTLHFTGLHLTGLQQFFASAVLASNIAANATIRPRYRMISTLHSLTGTV